MSRAAERVRKTRETEVLVRIELDGSGEADIATGIGFLDHMLDALARHSGFDLHVRATGDLHIDPHHTTEDIGITLGAAFGEALNDKRGVARFADATVPLDEALVRAVVDLSGRAFLHFAVPLPAHQPRIGEWDAALLPEFWRGFAHEARITLHLDGLRGDNAHHIVEACFKAAARALGAATQIDPRRTDAIPSTKGAL